MLDIVLMAKKNEREHVCGRLCGYIRGRVTLSVYAHKNLNPANVERGSSLRTEEKRLTVSMLPLYIELADHLRSNSKFSPSPDCMEVSSRRVEQNDGL